MSRHVHMPPLLPLALPRPVEKKDKARRKKAVASGTRPGTTKFVEVPDDGPPPPKSGDGVSYAGPIDGSTGALAVLLGAQEEVQPAPTRRADADEDFI